MCQGWCKRAETSEILFILKDGFKTIENPLEAVEVSLAGMPVSLDELADCMDEIVIETSDLTVRDTMTQIGLHGIARATCICQVVTIAAAMWPLLVYPESKEHALERLKHERRRMHQYNTDGTSLAG